jgi:hypothetical protein
VQRAPVSQQGRENPKNHAGLCFTWKLMTARPTAVPSLSGFDNIVPTANANSRSTSLLHLATENS